MKNAGTATWIQQAKTLEVTLNMSSRRLHPSKYKRRSNFGLILHEATELIYPSNLLYIHVLDVDEVLGCRSRFLMLVLAVNLVSSYKSQRLRVVNRCKCYYQCCIILMCNMLFLKECPVLKDLKDLLFSKFRMFGGNPPLTLTIHD